MLKGVQASSEQGKQWRQKLAQRFVEADPECSRIVAEILHAVRTRGDEAVLDYTRQFDAPKIQADQLRVTDEEFEGARAAVSSEFMQTLRLAVQRIKTFHEREMEDSWLLTREDGVITGRMVRPVDSAGLYVPGGQGGSTPLVSSVLMNGIPSGIAGVARRVLVTPPAPDGTISAALLMAAKEIGITEVYKVGSAWAVAALAYGTATIPRVDVLVGPGNQYVVEAKRQVMGRVRIDMIAGPSEVLILADQSADPAFIAADMLAQAEHDIQASALLVTTSEKLGEQVVLEIHRQLPLLPREEIARTALKEHGVILIADDLDQALEIANEVAVEHLEVQVEEPWHVLPKIRHAGAVFLGHYTPEAAGDYLAGPNHVLPTMGTARISSALGVETFLKKSSIISYSRQALQKDAEHIQRLAALEGLTAHGQSVSVRVPKK